MVFVKSALLIMLALLFLKSLESDAGGNHCALKCKNSGVCRIIFDNYDGYNQECICPNTHFGPMCEFRQCKDSPCKNGGVCEALGRSFRCHCRLGFGGDLCQQKVPNACDRRVCQHGRCELRDNVHIAVCRCERGYVGVDCSYADHCVLKGESACGIHGRCRNTLDGYNCVCDSGYTGPHCDKEVNECQINICASGSTCRDLMDGYECICPEDKVGHFCQYTNFCTSKDTNPCQNGGLCNATYEGDYTCQCTDGFTGNTCSLDINECAIQNQCGPHGECLNTPGSFHCQCNTGYSGTYCESDDKERSAFSMGAVKILLCSFGILMLIIPGIILTMLIFRSRCRGFYDMTA